MTAVNFPNRPAAEQRNIDRQRNCRLASETVTGTENAADIAPPNEEPPVSVDGRRMPGSGSQRHNTRQQPAAVRRHNPARLRFIPETARSEPAVAAASPCRHRSVAVQNRNMPTAASVTFSPRGKTTSFGLTVTHRGSAATPPLPDRRRTGDRRQLRHFDKPVGILIPLPKGLSANQQPSPFIDCRQRKAGRRRLNSH